MCKSWSDFLRSLKKREREESAMNRKMLAIGIAVGLCLSALGRPGPMPHHPHHHHNSAWGRGGSSFWPGFVGGVVIGSTIFSPPVVVTPPPPPGPYARQVWIEGHYETQIVNGIYTQIWVPGRWVLAR